MHVGVSEGRGLFLIAGFGILCATTVFSASRIGTPEAWGTIR